MACRARQVWRLAHEALRLFPAPSVPRMSPCSSAPHVSAQSFTRRVPPCATAGAAEGWASTRQDPAASTHFEATQNWPPLHSPSPNRTVSRHPLPGSIDPGASIGKQAANLSSRFSRGPPASLSQAGLHPACRHVAPGAVVGPASWAASRFFHQEAASAILQRSAAPRGTLSHIIATATPSMALPLSASSTQSRGFAKRLKKWHGEPFRYVETQEGVPVPYKQPNAGATRGRNQKRRMEQREKFKQAQHDKRTAETSAARKAKAAKHFLSWRASMARSAMRKKAAGAAAAQAALS